MAKPLLNKIYLDDVLAKFNVFGRYHRFALLYFSFACALNAIYYCNYIFVTEEVGFRCVSNEETQNFNTSNIFTNSSGCESLRSCTKWEYDNPKSFVAEFDLACQDWKRTLVGSTHAFGYMIGLLIIGPLSDRLGRRTLLVITGVSGAVFGLARTFTNYYWLIIVFEFLEAAFGDVYSPMFMLAIEMVSTKSRVTFNAMGNLGFSVGGVLFPLIVWLVPYWRTSLQIVYAPGLLFIFFIFLVDESPRWLLIKGERDKAVKIIEKAAKTNGMKLEEDLGMLWCDKEKSASFTSVLLETFKSRPLLKRFFVCTIWWTASSFVNQGMMINSVALQGNKYVNYAIASAVELPSQVIVAVILNKFNRKAALIWSFLICAFTCVAQPFLPTDQTWLIITFFMTGKFLSSMFFTITYIYTSELFPTYTRNSMHALCSSLGRIGSILAPQTPLLMMYWVDLPSIVFGIVSLIAGLLTFLVPDTSNMSLPDTVCEAEAMETKVFENDENLQDDHIDVTKL